MVRIGASDLAEVSASSSAMPLLKALMPLATSPIMSEILPRPPNTTRSTAPTINQCQMLKEPMKSSVRANAQDDPDVCRFERETRRRDGQNQARWRAAKPQA